MASTHHSNTILESDRLKVEIAAPGTYYKRSRFDWNGFITQVTLDGRHTFCVPESLTEGQGCGGSGFCGEFGIEEPIGYDETPVGGCFPKIGVGSVVKPDASVYEFSRDYEVKPSKARITAGKNRAEFLTNQTDCRGYAFLYKKTVSVEGSILNIEYNLKNSGAKAIRTTEYCHNFVRIDSEAVGSNYILKLPYKPEFEIICEGMELTCGNEITWRDEGWEQAFYCRISGYDQRSSHVWDLYNKKARAGVMERNDFAPARIAMWGMKHVISPEVFIEINLNPGEALSWTREYEFYRK